MQINALYITYDGLTDTLGQSQILPYLVGLSKKGISFTVLSAEKKHRLKVEGKSIRNICQKANINWEYIIYSKKPPIISSIYDIYKINRKAEKLHKKSSFDIVHSRSYMGSIVSLHLKQKYGVKFIFDMRGFFPDERVDGGSWNLKKWYYKKVYQYFKKKEKLYLNNSDIVVSLTHAAKNIMIKQWDISTPITVIPCATDLNLFQRVYKPPNERLRIGYLGSLGTWYMLPEMLQFYKTVQKKYKDVEFIILTPDTSGLVEEEAYRQSVSMSNIQVKYAKREDLPSILSTFNIGLFFIKPSFSKQASSPVKQGEYMSMGIPVITNSGVGDTDKIIQQYQSGILIPEFTQKEYQKAVDKIDDLLTWDSNNITQGAVDYFSLDLGVESYYQIYQKLCAE